MTLNDTWGVWERKTSGSYFTHRTSPRHDCYSISDTFPSVYLTLIVQNYGDPVMLVFFIMPQFHLSIKCHKSLLLYHLQLLAILHNTVSPAMDYPDYTVKLSSLCIMLRIIHNLVCTSVRYHITLILSFLPWNTFFIC